MSSIEIIRVEALQHLHLVKHRVNLFCHIIRSSSLCQKDKDRVFLINFYRINFFTEFLSIAFAFLR